MRPECVVVAIDVVDEQFCIIVARNQDFELQHVAKPREAIKVELALVVAARNNKWPGAQ